MSEAKIDKNKFMRYERVRLSGVINMIDQIKVCSLSRLTKKEYLTIIKKYREYESTYLGGGEEK